jgi:hypothetical protein
VRTFALVAALAFAGCGSMASAELPPPEGPPVSPPLAEAPARPVEPRPVAVPEGPFRVDTERHRLIRVADGREAPTGLAPIAVAVVDRGAKVVVLTGQDRTLELYDARTLERLGTASGGIAPTGLTSNGKELAYVTDVKGNAVLVYHIHPRFELTRRVHVSGGPYAIAFDEERWGLWIARPGVNRVDYYAAGARPVPRDSFATIRDAREVHVRPDVVLVRSPSEEHYLRPPSK